MKILSVEIRRELDEDIDLSWLGEYTDRWEEGAIDREKRGDLERNQFRYFVPATNFARGYDYKRMEQYNAGDWCMCGVVAEARVLLDGDVVQKITSGGLWGIESDSEERYFEEIDREQLSELRTQLEAVGFDEKAIDEAFAEATHRHFV